SLRTSTRLPTGSTTSSEVADRTGSMKILPCMIYRAIVASRSAAHTVAPCGGSVSPRLLEKLLQQVADRTLGVPAALDRLRTLPFEDLGFARLDHHRELRCGAPEVIFGRGKSTRQIADLFERFAAGGHNVLATRVGPRTAALVCRQFPK